MLNNSQRNDTGLCGRYACFLQEMYGNILRMIVYEYKSCGGAITHVNITICQSDFLHGPPAINTMQAEAKRISKCETVYKIASDIVCGIVNHLVVWYLECNSQIDAQDWGVVVRICSWVPKQPNLQLTSDISSLKDTTRDISVNLPRNHR